MKRITVVGGGNAGCFTALYCAWMDKQKDFEVELIYDPEIPPERVGQASILEASALLWATTDFNWYNNKINATMKSGILRKIKEETPFCIRQKMKNLEGASYQIHSTKYETIREQGKTFSSLFA